MNERENYKIYVELGAEDLSIETHLKNNKKINNYNRFGFSIDKQLVNVFSKYSVSNQKVKTYMKNINKNYSSEDILVSYLQERLVSILFNEPQTEKSKEFTQIISKITTKNIPELHKTITTIIKSITKQCITPHSQKHGKHNTTIQTLIDIGYDQKELKNISPSELKLMLSHHMLDKKLDSLQLKSMKGASLEEKRKIINIYKEKESITQGVQQIIIKDTTKKPKKPLPRKEKIPISHVYKYLNEE